LISGNYADIGKVKGPILRGLAAPAPYFHNGSAATLMDVVNFYDQRFGINFTAQQKQDLVNFLNTLLAQTEKSCCHAYSAIHSSASLRKLNWPK
jgi:cytochrome c peroxidase